MTNVKRLTVIALCVASCMGVAAQNDTSAQTPGSSGQLADSLPAQWDLQTCIDYALPHIIYTILYKPDYQKESPHITNSG